MKLFSNRNSRTASSRTCSHEKSRSLRLESLEPRHLLAVVINEIHYNSQDNTSAEEFVELYNTGSAAVDLSGWEFTEGIDYTFAPGQQIAGGGHLVIAQNPAVALEQFNVNAVGPYQGNLSSDGERVELRTAQGVSIDVVDYRAEFPWPIAASGDGGSMELINPDLDNNLGSSWRSSYVPPLFGEEPNSGGGTGSEDALGDLVHRWSFSGSLEDSVGNADGTLVNPSGGAFFSNGQLDVSQANSGQTSDQGTFTSGAYVDLPNGIISDLGTSATFEWWGTVTRNRVWAEIFSFGTSNAGEDQSTGAAGQDYLILIPEAQFNGGPLRVAHRDGGAGVESTVDRPGELATNTEHHLAVVWDGQADTQSLYVNGQLVGTSTTLIELSDINDVNNWLGRSNWNDPLFDGRHNEFRIYNRTLSGREINESIARGPDAVALGPEVSSFTSNDFDIVAGQSVTLSWDVSNFTSLSINQGVGDVTAPSQIQVSPTETTTYQLTASNPDGQTTRLVTIDVKVPRSSPAAENHSFQINAPPNIRQVNHTQSPTSADSGVVTAKVTDPNGVASVELEYQIVLPGQYIPARLPVPHAELLANGGAPTTPNPEYFDPANWTTLAMVDDGSGADAVAGDDIYTAAIPVQGHRTLVRYRIAIEDSLGASDMAPFADDQSLNFAYFVYDGVPDYRDNSGNVVADTATLNSAPTYQLLTRAEDMEDVLAYNPSDQIAQGAEARFAYNWGGTMVYDGVVYDNIKYRLRGANGRYYGEGKRSMRFRFNDGSYFQALDQQGNAYPEKWRTLTTGKGLDNHNTLTYGLNEAATLLLSNMIGVPASHTHWFNFRVIDGLEEAPDQWRGDYWGINFALETYDKRFLDAHELEKGNLYKLINQSTDALRQQRYQGADAVDDGSDHDFIEYVLGSNSTDIQHRVNLDKYYLFHALVESVRHYDYWPESNKNMVYYFEPDYRPENDGLGKLWLLPWDTDASWGPSWNEGEDPVYEALFENYNQAYSNQLIKPAYYNALREVRDLIWQPDQLTGILNELASVLLPLEAADRARWQNAPSDAGSYDGLGGAGATSISNLVQDMLEFAFVGGNWPHGGSGSGFVQSGGRAAYLDDQLTNSGEEALIPFTPTISYIGAGDFAADSLVFQTTPFSDPQGAGSFSAMQWRIAPVTDSAAGLDPNISFKDEWTASWDSGPLTTFASAVLAPTSAVQPGEAHRARVRFQDDTGRWSHWSAPVEFTPTAADHAQLAVEYLRISELQYHAHDGLPQFAEPNFDGDEFDFLELFNTSSTQTISLDGVQLAGGVTFTFGPNDELPPGGRILVVEDVGSFQARYGSGPAVAGKWSGALRNSGEELMLLASDGSIIHQFTYSDEWYSRTDGRGSSLVVVDTEGDYNSSSNWRASTAFGGTPAAAPMDALDVVVNEVFANSQLPDIDQIELLNVSASSVDLSNWWISDTADNLFKFQFDAGASLSAGAYIVLDESDFNATGGASENDFLLSSGGDDVWLLAADTQGRPLRFADVVHFDASQTGVSIGRVPDGAGPYGLFPLASRSFGSANGNYQTPQVAISELHYHPAAPPVGSPLTESQLEFVELYNPNSYSIDLSDWRLRGGTDFDFPAGVSLAAGSTLVLVNFNPADSTLSSEFRQLYGADSNVQLQGPVTGLLKDSGEEVKLLAPTTPPVGDPGPVFYLVDRVTYRDDSPWPVAADGQGDSLTRTSSHNFGDLATSWTAVSPSPGSVPFTPAYRADLNDDGVVNSADYTLWRDSLGQAVAVGTGADASNNGIIDVADYTIWHQHYGTQVPMPPTAASLVAPAAAALTTQASDTALLMLSPDGPDSVESSPLSVSNVATSIDDNLLLLLAAEPPSVAAPTTDAADDLPEPPAGDAGQLPHDLAFDDWGF